MPEPIRIDGNRQLFLDDFLIDSCDGMTRRVCPVRKSEANPVIWPEEDWEPRGYVARGSFMFDHEERLYKCWCSGVGEPRGGNGGEPSLDEAVYYFTSSDGVHWERPELDVVSIDGRHTNVVALGLPIGHKGRVPAMFEPFGAFKDPNDPDPARRYKMGYLYLIEKYRGPQPDPYHHSQFRGLGVAFSPDGTHWTPLPEAVSLATCDGLTHWCRDVQDERWILYGRTKHISPEMTARFGQDPAWQQSYWGRAVRRAESTDFLNWTPDEGELCLYADTEDGPYGEIYGMNVFPYEGLYIGLPQLYYNSPEDAYLEMQLAVSRDSRRFERLSDRSAFIPVGGVGAWDRFNNSNTTGPPLELGEELRFYYGGRNCRHPGAYAGRDDGMPVTDGVSGVGFGTVKRDRFAGLEATFAGGRLRTKPLVFSGRSLHVNVAVPFGRLEAALLDHDGRTIQGSEAVVSGHDALDVRLPIPGLSGKSGHAVRIQFTLHNGHLFSFWID